MPRTCLLLPCVFLAFSGLACDGGDDEPESYDPEDIIAQAVDFEANFERLDANGVETVHDSNDEMISSRIWANAAGAAVFRTLDPSDASQMVEMPRGAIFVKESFDIDGNPLEPMQILAKFEEGYFPSANDWFFAMINRSGEVLDETVGNGAKVTYCVDCHASMGEMTDYIIGLPPEELAP